MKVYGDTLIIGVDAGYGNMKTAACAFPTGLTAYQERPYFTENLLIYNDRFYIIGSGHKEFTSQKVMDEDYYVLTLAAIAREMNTQHLTSAKVLLAVGLPLTWFVKQQGAYRKYLLRNKTLAFSFRGVDYRIEISDVMVFPQGYAAIADRINEFQDVNICADIGNGTVNLFRVIDRRVDMLTMTTEACGVKDCAVAMRTALANQHHGAKVDDSVIERIIRSGTARIDAAYLETMVKAAREYTESLFRRFREYGYDAKTMRLFVMGGGSCLIRNFGSYDREKVTLQEDIHANAKGYEQLAYNQIKRGDGRQ